MNNDKRNLKRRLEHYQNKQNRCLSLFNIMLGHETASIDWDFDFSVIFFR